ncbi:hypothetical protein C4546_03650 [Candidatus Parcubacteria bacterium]|jgi:hypothetical protein|nr:MAG: hypothetical protein C4546_03650 [Candidatus Parcubacteria bacterium]
MTLDIPLNRIGNPLVFFSRLGYHRETNGSFAKRVARLPFPRFHVYLDISQESVRVNLHLDAKKPSYQGTSAHAGEYDGEVVEREMERIKQNAGL